jgi:hypothetical protein
MRVVSVRFVPRARARTDGAARGRVLPPCGGQRGRRFCRPAAPPRRPGSPQAKSSRGGEDSDLTARQGSRRSKGPRNRTSGAVHSFTNETSGCATLFLPPHPIFVGVLIDWCWCVCFFQCSEDRFLFPHHFPFALFTLARAQGLRRRRDELEAREAALERQRAQAKVDAMQEAQRQVWTTS